MALSMSLAHPLSAAYALTTPPLISSFIAAHQVPSRSQLQCVSQIFRLQSLVKPYRLPPLQLSAPMNKMPSTPAFVAPLILRAEPSPPRGFRTNTPALTYRQPLSGRSLVRLRVPNAYSKSRTRLVRLTCDPGLYLGCACERCFLRKLSMIPVQRVRRSLVPTPYSNLVRTIHRDPSPTPRSLSSHSQPTDPGDRRYTIPSSFTLTTPALSSINGQPSFPRRPGGVAPSCIHLWRFEMAISAEKLVRLEPGS
ncbi:hypothetical protein B0H15DRAFT_118778 [Mycena belliarum]|uniref:Uncharacterized protein n=1 Tax=Mycena belliarum TaxID=1033014 RepID=A0AAD6TM36_9AGAR|nr:hypothetical protein B0H15DRAFT_118778 [Mycena belliae]